MNRSELEEFESHIIKIHDELYLFLYKYFYNEAYTKDALQNTLIKAYKNYGSLNEKEKFKSWIFTIGKREALNIIKSLSREKKVNIDELNENFIDDNSFDLPETSILNKELKKGIMDAVNSLNDDLRQIVILKYYMEMSFEDISKIYDINVNTIRSRHFRAKKYIHKYITENQYI